MCLSWRWPCGPWSLAAARASAQGLLGAGCQRQCATLQHWAPAWRTGAAMGAECYSVLSLLLEPIHSPETHAAGTRAQTARPPLRRSAAPTTAPPNTHAPVPRQPRRPHGLAAPPGPGLPASGTQTTKKRSLTPMGSSYRRQRLPRLPGECTSSQWELLTKRASP